MPSRFDLLPDEIIEKIVVMAHNNLIKNVVKEIYIKDKAKDFSEQQNSANNGIIFRNILHVKDNRFLLQNVTYYIMRENNWFKFDKKTNTRLVNYWLNNITLCKYIFTKEHMLSIFNFASDIADYVKRIIYKKTKNKKIPLKQFHTIYLKKIGYNGKYLNTWKKAFEQLWTI
jgi:hypothetical protein